jgi:ribosomal protein S18 acetylase RimI-like enzyme
MQSDQFKLFTPSLPEDILAARSLFVEYANGLGIDLCFQNFESELANLPGDYVQPRGALIVAKFGERMAGCCALRPLDAVDYPNAAEMKRLFVHPEFRGFGIGKALAEAILDAARHADYSCVLLDTLTEMEAARAMYEDLGFVEIPPYYHNPIEGAHYLMVTL